MTADRRKLLNQFNFLPGNPLTKRRPAVIRLHNGNILPRIIKQLTVIIASELNRFEGNQDQI